MNYRKKKNQEEIIELIETIRDFEQFRQGFAVRLSGIDVDTRNSISRWEDGQIDKILKKATNKQIDEFRKLVKYKYEKCYIWDSSKPYNQGLSKEKRRISSFLEENAVFSLDYLSVKDTISQLCRLRYGKIYLDEANALLEDISKDADRAGEIRKGTLKWLFTNKEEKTDIISACDHLMEFDAKGDLSKLSEIIEKMKNLNSIDPKDDFDADADWYYEKWNAYGSHLVSKDRIPLHSEYDLNSLFSETDQIEKKLKKFIDDNTIKPLEAHDVLEYIEVFQRNLYADKNNESVKRAESLLEEISVSDEGKTYELICPLSQQVLSPERVREVLEIYDRQNDLNNKIGRAHV